MSKNNGRKKFAGVQAMNHGGQNQSPEEMLRAADERVLKADAKLIGMIGAWRQIRTMILQNCVALEERAFRDRDGVLLSDTKEHMEIRAFAENQMRFTKDAASKQEPLSPDGIRVVRSSRQHPTDRIRPWAHLLECGHVYMQTFQEIDAAGAPLKPGDKVKCQKCIDGE